MIDNLGVHRLRAALTTVLLLVLGGGLLSHATPLTAQTPLPNLQVLLTITDQLSGSPVVGAVVTLTPVDSEGQRTGEGRVYGTDEDGRVRTQPVSAGRYLVDVRAPGYRAVEEVIDLAPPSPVSVTIRLVPDVVELDAVLAVAERNPFLEAGGFYERQAQGFGVTFSRQDLEALGVFQATDVFRTISGVTLDFAGSPTSPFVRFRGGCRPDIVVDGANLGFNVRLDEVVNPATIEGMEVYRGTTAPSTLSDNPCGAVLIWTLRPPGSQDDLFSWGRLAFGVVVVVLFQILRPTR